ncbi:hypothetical protein ACFE04_016268 [Oxalis oulophora]
MGQGERINLANGSGGNGHGVLEQQFSRCMVVGNGRLIGAPGRNRRAARCEPYQSVNGSGWWTSSPGVDGRGDWDSGPGSSPHKWGTLIVTASSTPCVLAAATICVPTGSMLPAKTRKRVISLLSLRSLKGQGKRGIRLTGRLGTVVVPSCGACHCPAASDLVQSCGDPLPLIQFRAAGSPVWDLKSCDDMSCSMPEQCTTCLPLSALANEVTALAYPQWGFVKGEVFRQPRRRVMGTAASLNYPSMPKREAERDRGQGSATNPADTARPLQNLGALG